MLGLTCYNSHYGCFRSGPPSRNFRISYYEHRVVDHFTGVGAFLLVWQEQVCNMRQKATVQSRPPILVVVLATEMNRKHAPSWGEFLYCKRFLLFNTTSCGGPPCLFWCHRHCNFLRHNHFNVIDAYIFHRRFHISSSFSFRISRIKFRFFVFFHNNFIVKS